ncbi:JAB domain-containing protein [uncultured Parasphingorhabdus sp.]|uniref:JAB domain-containing protein n=1 Tax=uncultured Parasphingorhabdus sp. TaxID=2709694 RepID=UPI0030D96DAE
MRSFTSDNRASGSRHKDARRDDSTKSLYDHANSFFLSIAGRADDRDVLPPEKTDGHRDRHILAQLIEILEPDDAARLSTELLDEFGSIGRLMGESEAALARVLRDNRAIIRLLKATEKITLVSLQNQLPRKLISATDQRLVRYLRACMGSRTTEIMRVLFLDSSNHLLGDQEFGAGSPQRMFVQPRSIVKRALEFDASGIILAHNHPGGTITPSKSDIEFTKSIKALCMELEIRLHDHIIITRDQWASFRKLRII